MKIKDVGGRTIQFDETKAEQDVREFLSQRYPAGFTQAHVRRGIAALKRQAAGREIGALAREFSY
jgi:hypothetical protein